MIKTWQQRCEEHPGHEGIVTEQMIRERMQEEIDELRQAIEQAEKQEPVIGTKTWFEDGKVVTQHLHPSDIYTRPVVHAVRCTYPQCQATNGCVGACSKTAPVHASDTNQERVDETAKDRHEPESNNVEIAAEQSDNYAAFLAGVRFAKVNLLAPSKEWVGLTDGEMVDLLKNYEGRLWTDIFPAIEAKLKEKNT
jgi:hypothetical protein